METKQGELGPIGQVSRTVRDIKEAEAWYRNALGLRHLYTFGNLAFFDCGGTRLYLSAGEGGASAAESILYFRVADITAKHAELVSRGVIEPELSVKLMADAREAVLNSIRRFADSNPERSLLQEAIHDAVSQTVYKRTRRRPMVIPVITEI